MKNNLAITLMELLVALGLLSMIVLAISSIDTFSRFHTFTTDRRAQVQNEASIAVEHMSKKMAGAIGEKNDYPVDTTAIGGDTAIRVRVDDGDGQLDAEDYWIAYRYKDASAPANDRYQLWYYAKCVGPNCNQSGTIGPEVTARKVSAFAVSVETVVNPVTGKEEDKYILAQIDTCWDSSGACGSLENPTASMRTRIHLPSVSLN